jgi:sRNA-binding carbon storage regulator CsrA
MLILSRVPPQKIIIGDKGDISICVLSVNEDEVKLGLIAANKDITINGMKTRYQPAQKRWKIPLSVKIKAFCAKISKIAE